jgi:pheromone shutdown protein TraB
MATIADLIGLDRDRPRWETITAWEVTPGDLVHVASDDVRLVERVWMNESTGEVSIEWASGRFTDLEANDTMRVKRDRSQKRKATP